MCQAPRADPPTSTPRVPTPVKRLTIPTAPVESTPGLVAAKRKASSPTTQPAKTKPPQPPTTPNPLEEDEWTLAVNGLRRQLHPYMQGDTAAISTRTGDHWETAATTSYTTKSSKAPME
ncbi:gibberellin-regulated protein 14-like [Gigantopelta aegis]|uniref:gibberellin-regulated protein 14-like n=1 Tax=Gigantopelta aegis TaxID=1735272 RepID=UPI001B88CF4A|nr:gibberellin-regulated protein 14-like [Gigantopelta aegis]